MKRFNIKSEIRKASVFNVLQAIEEMAGTCKSNKKSKYPSTREIADRCNLSIYSTRHILLLLSEKNIIAAERGQTSRYLYWRRTQAPGLQE